MRFLQSVLVRRRRYLVAACVIASQLACDGSDAPHPSGEAKAPPHPVAYRVVEQWAIPNGGFGKVIVVADTAANEMGLRALGEELKFDTRDDRNAFIDIYNDARAPSMRSAALRDALSKRDERMYYRHFVATYGRNANTGYHQLTIAPDGMDGRQIEVDY